MVIFVVINIANRFTAVAIVTVVITGQDRVDVCSRLVFGRT
jgi:hypothetical protein